MTDSILHIEQRDELLTPKEVAALLRLSVASVYRLVDRRDLPFHSIRRSLRFKRGDVEAFVARCRIEPLEQTL